MNAPTTSAPAERKKLIEVALPLEAINAASAREKSIRHGHPSTLHLWWARRPLAACRAVLFSSIVDDPSSLPHLFPDEASQERERERLFDVIRELVLWESTTDEKVLHRARTEIARSVARTHGVELSTRLSEAQVREALAKYAPPVLDPFCGGGSIPLEAQRLGLEAHGSDLNPVAVLITKALIEIPPRFAGQPPVNPADRKRAMGESWKGAAGLAADVRHYGAWMRDEAFKRIGHLYPRVHLPPEQGGGEATVIAWLWARTVTCPNPACGAQMPLVRSFALSTKKGKQAWVEPIVDRDAKTVRFEVKTGVGVPPEPPKTGRGASFRCLVCGEIAKDHHIKAEGMRKRLGAQLLGIVGEGNRGRVYTSPSAGHVAVALNAPQVEGPTGQLADDPRNIWCVNYGLTEFKDLFTPRQLVALTTFSDLVGEARERARQDALAAGLADDGILLADGGNGAQAYADAVATYLALGVSRMTDISNALCRWETSKTQVRNLFGRQAIPMIWDFAENNVFAGAAGDYATSLGSLVKALETAPAYSTGTVRQDEAAKSVLSSDSRVVSTDPPYYDNIGYADLSDFFYVWLRRMLSSVHYDTMETLLTPKTPELVATPYRFGGSKLKAKAFFESGLGEVFQSIRDAQSPEYPTTVYYAFKQSESTDSGDDSEVIASSTGWETMLTGLMSSGLVVRGTWPMRSELSNRMVGKGKNALASSIVLVCRPRPETAASITRQRFVQELRSTLPEALRQLQHGNIAPVDLAQAAIGPGMAVFSKYARVLESSGNPMSVRTALQLINKTLDEVLAEQEGDVDADTRWSLAWFEQFGMEEGQYGTAETLSNAKNTSVAGLQESGILQARAGKVRLLRREELNADWQPDRDRRLSDWEITQRLTAALQTAGELGAASMAAQIGSRADVARDLAYRLYRTSELKGWTQEALAYNSLVVAWPDIVTQMQTQAQTSATEQQRQLI